uniref:Uncharacterized protein n=1 Tax=Anguilla anguilla TaxID=7936 RepID=A0A0E9W4X0_ANGAN
MVVLSSTLSESKRARQCSFGIQGSSLEPFFKIYLFCFLFLFFFFPSILVL